MPPAFLQMRHKLKSRHVYQAVSDSENGLWIAKLDKCANACKTLGRQNPVRVLARHVGNTAYQIQKAKGCKSISDLALRVIRKSTQRPLNILGAT